MKHFLIVLTACFLLHLPASSQEKPKQVPALVIPDKNIPEEVIRSTRDFRTRLLVDSSPDEPLVLRIFVDKSIVEVFANDRQSIGRMVYPTLDGSGISLFAEGGDAEVKSVKAWELSPSNPY